MQRRQRRRQRRQQLGQRQEPMRQQQEQVLVQELQQVLVQELVLLLSYRKRPEQQMQRSLPKREICSFFDSLMNIRKQFSGDGQPKAVDPLFRQENWSSSSPTQEYIRINPQMDSRVCQKLSKLVQKPRLNAQTAHYQVAYWALHCTSQPASSQSVNSSRAAWLALRKLVALRLR